MCELQKLSLEAHDKALLDLQKWFKGVTLNMKELEVNRRQERSRLYLSDTPIYLDASSIITSSVHSNNPDFIWLTKLKIQADDPILEKLKDDPVMEKENKELKKELFEERNIDVVLQRKLIAQQEETRVREENLVRGYNELKQDM